MPQLYKKLTETIKSLQTDFTNIPSSRKEELKQVADYVKSNIQSGKVEMTFICTHNSRRSHMTQLWAQVASRYYGIQNVYCYSGGTEATAFFPSAVEAMKTAGFKIETSDNSNNPIYNVQYSDQEQAIKAFSKTYSDPFNPQLEYIAFMTCDHANEACPVVTGAKKKFSVLYKDPKASDGTPEQAATYLDRCLQIGTEMLYLFSQVK